MRFVSIMGDSISTYIGFNPKGYEVFYDEYNNYKNKITSVYDTWWAKVNQYLHAYLCVNNSYSGSRVSGKEFPSAGSDERTCSLHTAEYSPDLILVYIGFNDFGDGIQITDTDQKEVSFFESYYSMLIELKQNYPKSRIICGTLMQSSLKDEESWKFPQRWNGISIYEYNAAIKIAVKLADVELADVAQLGIRYETLDGTHPTVAGHETIAQAWIDCLKISPSPY